MLGWLGKKAAAKQAEEIDRFLQSVRGADQASLDGIAAMTMFWAAHFDTKNQVDLYKLASLLEVTPSLPLVISNTIGSLQKQGSTASAVGLMTWLHSSRALADPALRLQGRQLWVELVRATWTAEDMALEMIEASGLRPVSVNRTRVPYGLEAPR